jgi:hypothetical protein
VPVAVAALLMGIEALWDNQMKMVFRPGRPSTTRASSGLARTERPIPSDQLGLAVTEQNAAGRGKANFKFDALRKKCESSSVE